MKYKVNPIECMKVTMKFDKELETTIRFVNDCDVWIPFLDEIYVPKKTLEQFGYKIGNNIEISISLDSLK